mmetsp:Transcript_1534/g.1959  ORF Transcript_1534/g.1959 Transcript_1534/m.1959 type:complete len:128 (+) Transcript_1534:494-877(+)
MVDGAAAFMAIRFPKKQQRRFHHHNSSERRKIQNTVNFKNYNKTDQDDKNEYKECKEKDESSSSILSINSTKVSKMICNWSLFKSFCQSENSNANNAEMKECSSIFDISKSATREYRETSKYNSCEK